MPENSPTTATCPVCRKAIVPGSDTTIAAGGRALFKVHQGECAQTVQLGVKTAGSVALNIAEVALEARAPRALAIVKGFAGILQHLRGA